MKRNILPLIAFLFQINRLLNEINSVNTTNCLISKIDDIKSKCMIFVNKTVQTSFAAHAKVKNVVIPVVETARDKKPKNTQTKKSMKFRCVYYNDYINVIFRRI